MTSAPSAVEQARVRKERKRLEAALREAQLAVENERDRLRALQRRCMHPHLRRTAHQGEIGQRCDDCAFEV